MFFKLNREKLIEQSKLYVPFVKSYSNKWYETVSRLTDMKI